MVCKQVRERTGGMSMAFHPWGERTAVWGMMPSICCIWKHETRTVGIECWLSASWQLSSPRQTEESPPSTICWLLEIVSWTEECRGQMRVMPGSAMPTAGFRSLLHHMWLSSTASWYAYCKYLLYYFSIAIFYFSSILIYLFFILNASFLLVCSPCAHSHCHISLLPSHSAASFTFPSVPFHLYMSFTHMPSLLAHLSHL